MLYFIGLGLGDINDITLRGKNAVEESEYVFLEYYTSMYGSSAEDIAAFFGKDVVRADRQMVESRAEEILEKAKIQTVSFLVVGDPFTATTHSDLWLRAQEEGIECQIIHNANILSAVGQVGLQLYKYGKTTSLVYPEDNYFPMTAYDVIAMNKEHGLHTLVLLDIKMDEGRFMTASEGAQLLLDMHKEKQAKVHGESVLDEATLAIVTARLGQDDASIIAAPLAEIAQMDFGQPLHSIIVPGKLHFHEEDILARFISDTSAAAKK